MIDRHQHTARRHLEGLRAKTERGEASISFLLIFPILMLMMMMTWQAVLLFQARSIAMTAASDAARIASAYSNGSDDLGRAAAQDVISNSNAGLHDTTISISHTPATVTVTVTVHPVELVSGVDIPITQSASLPVKRLT